MCALSFPKNTLRSSSHLPLTLMSLDEWCVVSVQGLDSAKYLQGQLTIDVMSLPENMHRLCAHCDPKGKMWSSLRLFHNGEGFAYIVRRNLLENQINELKKYAIFSKVTIEPHSKAILLGVAGRNAREVMHHYYAVVPDKDSPVTYIGGTLLLWLSQPEERFLIITDEIGAQKLKSALSDKAELNNSRQWMALDIEAGLPLIDVRTSGMFIPQATNLQALDAIDFHKGCYTGQEMVARAQFRGANKRALYWLAGKGRKEPKTGDSLELKIGEHWRRTGTVLASLSMDNEEIWVQAVLNQDLCPKTELRVEGCEEGGLKIQALAFNVSEAEV